MFRMLAFTQISRPTPVKQTIKQYVMSLSIHKSTINHVIMIRLLYLRLLMSVQLTEIMESANTLLMILINNFAGAAMNTTSHQVIQIILSRIIVLLRPIEFIHQNYQTCTIGEEYDTFQRPHLLGLKQLITLLEQKSTETQMMTHSLGQSSLIICHSLNSSLLMVTRPLGLEHTSSKSMDRIILMIRHVQLLNLQ